MNCCKFAELFLITMFSLLYNWSQTEQLSNFGLYEQEVEFDGNVNLSFFNNGNTDADVIQSHSAL